MFSCIVGAILCHGASFAIDGSLKSDAPDVRGNWGYVVYAGPILAPGQTRGVVIPGSVRLARPATVAPAVYDPAIFAPR